MYVLTWLKKLYSVESDEKLNAIDYTVFKALLKSRYSFRKSSIPPLFIFRFSAHCNEFLIKILKNLWNSVLIPTVKLNI